MAYYRGQQRPSRLRSLPDQSVPRESDILARQYLDRLGYWHIESVMLDAFTTVMVGADAVLSNYPETEGASRYVYLASAAAALAGRDADVDALHELATSFLVADERRMTWLDVEDRVEMGRHHAFCSLSVRMGFAY